VLLLLIKVQPSIVIVPSLPIAHRHSPSRVPLKAQFFTRTHQIPR